MPTPAQLEILRRASVADGWYVDAENLLDVAILMNEGLVTLEADYGIIYVRLTPEGKALCPPAAK